MKHIFLFLIGMLCLGNIYSQTVFSGQIVDEEGNGIPYAQIYFTELETGTYADSLGNFVIEHYPQKPIHIQVSSLGFETINQQVDLTEQKEVKLTLKASHYDIDEVVLSVPTGRLKSDNIIDVEVKRMDELEGLATGNLATALTEMSGVEQVSSGTGIGKPVIRGLSGNRILVYTQGIRLENQQWGAEHGLGVAGNGIGAVEVIKGPASLLYGADALGGVLYLVDEKYIEHDKWGVFYGTNFDFNNNGTKHDAGFQIHKHKLKLNLFGTYINNADYRFGTNQYVINSRNQLYSGKVALGYNNKNWITNLRYSYTVNQPGILMQDSLFSTSNSRLVIHPFQQTTQQLLSSDNTWLIGKSRLKMVLGWSGNLRKEFEEEHHEEHHDEHEEPADHEEENHEGEEAALEMMQNTYSYQLSWKSKVYDNGIHFVSGVQGMLQSFDNHGEEILVPNSTSFDNGIYTVGFYEKGAFKAQAGLRWDYKYLERELSADELVIMIYPPINQKKFNGFNYAFGGAYQISELHSLRLNLASGFRAPNAMELFAGGVHHGSNQHLEGDHTLLQENGNQLDVSYHYKGEHLSFSVNPFANYIQNYIHLNLVDPTGETTDGIPHYEYIQLNAMLYGGEAGFHYHPHQIHGLHIASNFSSVFGQEENGTWLNNIPSHKIFTMVRLDLPGEQKVRWTDFYVSHRYKFAQTRIAIFEIPTADYHLFNIGLKGVIGKSWDFNVSVENVLNTNYKDHLSRYKDWGVLNKGRTLNVGLKYHFKK